MVEAMVRRRRTRNPFRSMDWLRAAGVMYRLRALFLLLAFAIGSLVARDVVFIQQVMTLSAAEAVDDAPEDGPSFAQAPPKLKGRPKAISRRMAMNPWDPPDDDDELDDDSDSTAAGEVQVAVLPAALLMLGAPELIATQRVRLAGRDESRPTVDRLPSPRGPPPV